MARNSWDSYFLEIAQVVASRATCDRRQVGAVFVRDKNILATGYNGSITGLGHCDELGHDVEDHGEHGQHCVRTIHAEINAIVQAAKHGVRLRNSILYVTTCPCWHCFKAVANLGAKRIVYRDDYKNDWRMLQAAKELGILLEKLG